MKKKLAIMIAGMLGVSCAVAAFDTVLLNHDAFVPAQASTLDKESVLLVGPVAVTNGGADVEGTAVDVSEYAGYGRIVGGLGARSGADHTSTVAVVYGFTESPDTALVTYTQTTATAKYESTEIDFATLKGTNAALYVKATFSNVAGDENAMVGGAVLVRDKARTALQTVTGSAVDTIDYHGNGCIVVQIGNSVLGSTNFVGSFVVQSSANGSTAWTNVTGKVASVTGATGSATTIPYEFSQGKRYLRGVYTTSNDVASVSATIHSFK